MNRFIHGSVFISLIFLLLVSPLKSYTQDTTGIQNYQEQIKRLMGFLEFSLNTLGDPETSTKEKEIIINESYIKAFMSEKVQVEDDLDENREILTYKDVQAYLKDVDFFFKTVEFNFKIQDIQSLTNPEGMVYFKVTANRNLKGETVEGELVSNNKTRFIEINVDDEEQVLKIASIYTTKLNEAEELMAWWNKMSPEWKHVLGDDFILQDSIRLSQVDFLNDSTILLIDYRPDIVEVQKFIYIGGDSLLIFDKDTLLTELFDTIHTIKGKGFRALREIIKLESLDVSDNPLITDLDPIDQLTELKMLKVSNTVISDLFPVRSLTRLLVLNISNTRIGDLEPIRYNTRIRELYADSTLIESLEPIADFAALEILYASGSRVMDLNPLRRLSLLKEIRIDDTPVRDIAPLSDLPALEILSISGTQVDALEAIRYMISLRRLSFKNTGIDRLSALSGLANLQVIDADQSRIADLIPLGDIPALEKVYCDQTGITRAHANAFMSAHPGVLVIYESQGLTDWWSKIGLEWQQVFREYVTLDPRPTKEQLHQVTLISRLDLRGNGNITTLEPLSILTNLKEIMASGTYVSDLKPLAELTNLVKLSVAGTRISSLEPLSSLSRLEELDLSDTPVDSLTGLNDLKNLRILSMDKTSVNDLDPLAPISSLKIIYCDNTRIGKTDLDRFLDLHPECLVVFQTALLKSWWDELPQPWKSVFQSHTKLDEIPTREQLHAAALLKSLSLSEKRDVSDLGPLRTLSRLEELDLSNGILQDISPVSDLVRLKQLNLSGNPVSSLGPLAGLPELKVLDISDTPVEKLDELKNITSLEQLNCSGTQIKKLDPLANLSNLKKLECQNTGINNLKPLTQLFQLKNLVCYNTKLNDKKVSAFREMMPGVEVVYY